MKWFLGLFATVVLLMGFGMGQTNRLVAEVPFDFIVGNTELPAGEYYFGLDRGSQVLRLTGEERSMYRLVMPGQPNGKGRSEVVFHRYPDGTYFLAQICIPGASVHDVVKSKLEGTVTTDWSLKKIAIQLRPSAGSPLRTARSGR